jgi:hypothetical protein
MGKRFHENSIGESSEWYTPPEIFEALGLVFDLDPCSPGADKCFVPAQRVFTIQDDGLCQPWGDALVFMNQPFGGRYSHLPWLRKFFDHGNGIAVCRAYTSSNWWHDLIVPRAETLVFPRGKTCFIRPDGTPGKEPGHGIALIGMGAIANEALARCKLGWFMRLRTALAQTACADCGVDTMAIGDFYAVKDNIWQRAWESRRGNYEIPHRQFLCLGCLEDRLGYTLMRDDFIDALVNHPKNPNLSKRLLDRVIATVRRPVPHAQSLKDAQCETLSI